MADLDDDFGDIYTEVDTQASSAINGVSNFTQFYTQPEEEEGEDRNDSNNDKKNGGEGLVSDSKQLSSVSEELGGKVSGSESNEEYSDSDSEDDLNIVLNDEGCKGIPFPISGGGSMRIDDCDDEDDDAFVAIKDSKYVWTQGSACASNGRGNESVDLVSSMPFGGDHSQISCVRDTPNPVVTRNRFGFRLPWYRTILDVDIESFEEKSWRYPGVDLTDYFNFDLNEDSWKEYCKSLQQLRRVKSMQYGTPGSSKFYQANEAGSEHGIFAQEIMSTGVNYAGSWTYAPPSSTVSDCRPIGNTIQIEDSIVERQPSFDSRHPRSWNSDVVIQISVQDPTQETPNSSAEHGHTNSRAHEKSENGEFDANGNQDYISYDDDSSLGSPEVDVRTLDGCSQKISVSHPMTIDSDDHRNNKVIDVDGNRHKEVNGISLEAIELANKVTESPDRNTSSADQYMMETQLSLSDDDDEVSLISSCFESDSEASRNSAHFDPEDIHTPVRSVVNSQTEPSKSATSSFKNSKGNCIKRKRVDIQDYSMCRSSSQKKHNHQGGRLNSIDGPSNHRNNDNDMSLTSDTEDPNDWNGSENPRGQEERLRGSGDINRADISEYKEPKFSCHYGIRNADNHDQNKRKQRKYSSRKGSHQLQRKLDRYVNRTFNERQNCCEDTDTDWNHFGITRFTEERSPLTSRESRGLHARYSYTVGKRDAQWRRNSNKLLFKKIPNSKWHEDDFLGEKAGRCTSFTSRKRNNFDDFDERKFPPVRRQLNNWGRRGGYVGSPMYLDDLHSENFEDVHCKPKENRHLRHQSYRDKADDGSWKHSISPRIDVFCPRTTDERYWRHVRKIDVEEANEIDWFDDHYDGYEIEDNVYANDHLRWRRSNWGSEVMHWTEDQFTVRHHADKLYSEKASCSYRKYVRHEKFHAKYGPLSDGMRYDNMQPEQRRLKMPRKEIGANFVNRSVKMYRGKHEQSVRCRNSMDLAVRERKILTRCSKARNLMHNGRPENMGAEIGGEWMTSGISQACESEKARAVKITQNIIWNQNNKKGHDIFPVTAQNADLDIEEGQIVTQEQNTTHPLQRKHASDYTEPADSLIKGVFDSRNASKGNKVVEGYDKQRILQTMAKMEQRGERFKEPITLKKEPDKQLMPEVDPTVETADEKQHRPARKRQWGGRFSKNDSLTLGIPLKARF
uniref:FIP1[V]-like protein isoform X2 n=1 Tax=Fragaria vesca subsp. vesca TaxID=101020 RepID=UPI0005C816F3|nr:PREDICTED: FIP1[V]-like protein isoform X2 [Fragaria vesca subsp. vesca]